MIVKKKFRDTACEVDCALYVVLNLTLETKTDVEVGTGWESYFRQASNKLQTRFVDNCHIETALATMCSISLEIEENVLVIVNRRPSTSGGGGKCTSAHSPTVI